MMTVPGAESGPSAPLQKRPLRRVRGFLVLAMGGLAFASPFFAGPMTLFLVGLLLIASGILEFLRIFYAADDGTQRSAYLGGMLSILGGILLLVEPRWVIHGLSIVLALSFLIDGLGKFASAWKASRAGRVWGWTVAAGLINLGLAFVLINRWSLSGMVVIAWVVGCRLLASGWAMMLDRTRGPEPVVEIDAAGAHPDSRLHLPAHPRFVALDASMKIQEEGRWPIDAYWCWTFVILFFAIHFGRMNVSWNLVGLISPVVAVVGDIATALLLAFGIIMPVRLSWRKVTRPVEKRFWQRILDREDRGLDLGLLDRLSNGWLLMRYRSDRTFAQMWQSPRAALRWGMRAGLPATAILIAVNPIWGLNWFFNSECWATGVWDRWAEARTDHWREKMIEAVARDYPDIPADRLFAIDPVGVGDGADFTFLVIGDTGEGGSAQHSLRDRTLSLSARSDVKFLVVSSDVIYPSGAMADYEPKFHLPFKGIEKPIYAIPGNHDWYDALEGFNANFLEPGAARASMLARIETDERMTSTTENHIDALIAEAGRLRREYGTRTGFQRGPFFELQTPRFALLAVDTGVIRDIDSKQGQWLRGALERSRGKFTLAILGHPLYAGGRYQAGGDQPLAGEGTLSPALANIAGSGNETESFAAIHRLLKAHDVRVVMAGDTHYFEHYVEQHEAGGEARTMYHFVNGGGGAYMSIGTPLDWPRRPALPDGAFYPRTDAVIDKLDRATPIWKMPLWWWAKHLRGWPASAEMLAGAFDYSRAPFFQSFVEIRVERSRNRVRLIPHGTRGPLTWGELDTFGGIVPVGKSAEDLVEFVVPMPNPGP